MTITDLRKKGKRGENIVVYLDGTPFCVLSLETILKARIEKGMDVDKEALHTLQYENEKLVCFDKALSFISHGMKSEKQIRDKLKEKGFLPDTIEFSIGKLKEYHYCDDSLFSTLAARELSKTKGKRAIAFTLRQKGVSDDKIQESLSQIENESATCLCLAEKYLKNKVKDQKTKQKLFSYLTTRGFSYSDIKNASNKLFQNCVEDDDENWD